MLQTTPDSLDLVDGNIVERETGEVRMPLAELGRIVYFRGDTLPPHLPRELVQTRHFITKEFPFAFTNGVQASLLEVDIESGLVHLLKHWVGAPELTPDRVFPASSRPLSFCKLRVRTRRARPAHSFDQFDADTAQKPG